MTRFLTWRQRCITNMCLKKCRTPPRNSRGKVMLFQTVKQNHLIPSHLQKALQQDDVVASKNFSCCSQRLFGPRVKQAKPHTVKQTQHIRTQSKVTVYNSLKTAAHAHTLRSRTGGTHYTPIQTHHPAHSQRPKKRRPPVDYKFKAYTQRMAAQRACSGIHASRR